MSGWVGERKTVVSGKRFLTNVFPCGDRLMLTRYVGGNAGGGEPNLGGGSYPKFKGINFLGSSPSVFFLLSFYNSY